jgi:cleavage stimulation factor subunit 3
VVNRLTQKPDSAARAKPLFLFFHEYESRYGELTQIVKLEKRMNDLFPEDPQLARFAQRFSTPTFDPTTVRPIISPKVQMKPVMLNMPPAAVVPSAFNSVLPTVEEPAPVPQIPERRPSPPLNSYDLAPALVNSPKRPFADLDDEIAQPRKLARGESPLKGAAGRRLVAARGGAVRPSDGFSHTPVAPTPMPLPREINFLLSIIPSASIFNVHNGTKFIPEEAIALLRALDLSQANLMPPQTHTPVAPPVQPPMGQPMMGYWGPPPPQGYYGH